MRYRKKTGKLYNEKDSLIFMDKSRTKRFMDFVNFLLWKNKFIVISNPFNFIKRIINSSLSKLF